MKKHQQIRFAKLMVLIFIAIISLLAGMCEKLKAQEDTIYCPYKGAVIASISMDELGGGIVYTTSSLCSRTALFTYNSGKALWYNPNAPDVKVHTLGVGFEVYQYKESHTFISINYNKVMNYSELSSQMKIFIDDNLHMLSLELIGLVDIGKRLTGGLGYDPFNAKGRFLVGLRF